MLARALRGCCLPARAAAHASFSITAAAAAMADTAAGASAGTASLAAAASSVAAPASAAAAPPAAPAASPSPSRKYRVYTRTGDKGTSSLYNGQRRPKDDVSFDALGDVDELNAAIGLAREHVVLLRHVGIDGQLVDIQSRLLDVGSAIATPLGSSSPEQLARVAFPPLHAEELERWIDAMDDELPALKNFILPGGGLASAQLHVARTVCRRAERLLVVLVRDGQLAPDVSVYVNRLSDYLFVAARYAAMKAHAVESVYSKAKGLKERTMDSGAGAASDADKAARAALRAGAGAHTEANGREDDDRSSVASNDSRGGGGGGGAV